MKHKTLNFTFPEASSTDQYQVWPSHCHGEGAALKPLGTDTDSHSPPIALGTDTDPTELWGHGPSQLPSSDHSQATGHRPRPRAAWGRPIGQGPASRPVRRHVPRSGRPARRYPPPPSATTKGARCNHRPLGGPWKPQSLQWPRRPLPLPGRDRPSRRPAGVPGAPGNGATGASRLTSAPHALSRCPPTRRSPARRATGLSVPPSRRKRSRPGPPERRTRGVGQRLLGDGAAPPGCC